MFFRTLGILLLIGLLGLLFFPQYFEKSFKKAEKTNQKVGDVLVSEGVISQEELIKLEAYILGIPFVLRHFSVVLPKSYLPFQQSNNLTIWPFLLSFVQPKIIYHKKAFKV